MLLRLNTDDKTLEMHEPDDCDDFIVEVNGTMDPAEVDETIASAGAGRLVGPHAWIAIESIRVWAEGKTSDDWDKRFQMLLDRASRAGRMNDDRSYLYADYKKVGS
jgi:hypothetical protein